MLFQAHHRSSEAAQQRNALQAKVKDLSRGVLPTQPSSCCSTPRIHESSPVPCSPQLGGQSSFTDRYVETNRRRQQNSVLTKGQVITPVQCLAWRPRLTCQRRTAPQPAPRAPAKSSPAGPGAGRAGDSRGSGRRGAGGSNGAVSPTGCPPQARLTTTDLKPGRREKAQNSGLSLCIISLAARVVFLRMAFRFSLDLRAGLRLAEAGLPEVNG